MTGAGASPRVSRLTPARLSEVRRLEAQALPPPWTEGSWRAELSRDDRCWLVALANDGAEQAERVVGFAGLWLGLDEAHVLRVAVAPAWRRRGVGSRLTRALLDAACAAGLERVTLEVRSDNGAALACYERLGFVTAGRRPGYYPDGTDAVICWWPELP